MNHLYHKFDREYEIELEVIGEGVIRADDYRESLDSIIFRRNGSAAIEMCSSSSGSSAGNTFGGTFYRDLPQEFWKTMTVGEVCSGHPEGIIKDGRLAKFMEMARARDNIFTGEN